MNSIPIIFILVSQLQSLMADAMDTLEGRKSDKERVWNKIQKVKIKLGLRTYGRGHWQEGKVCLGVACIGSEGAGKAGSIDLLECSLGKAMPQKQNP